MNKITKEIRRNILKCLQFLSSEFSKYVSVGNNHEYLISSMFTEILTKNSIYDGIVYPSVQLKGYGLCVAIHLKALNKINLTKVLQCKLTKTSTSNNKNNFVLSN